MQVLGTRLASEYPQEDPGRGISVFASKDVRVHPQMDALLAPVASVLLGVGTTSGLTLSMMAIQALRAVRVSTPGISLYRPTADPVAMLAIAAFMAAVGAAAASIPAWRAATMEPLNALRHD